MRPLSDSARYRWSVFSRVVAASLGSYALTWAAIVLLALIWPLPRAQAAGLATMLGFVIFAGVAMWVFTTRSAGRAWCGLIGWTALLAALDWWLLQGSAA